MILSLLNLLGIMAQEEKKHPKAICDAKTGFCSTCLYGHFMRLYKVKTNLDKKDDFVQKEAYWSIIEIRNLYENEFNQLVAESSMAPQLPGLLNFQDPYNVFLDMLAKLGTIRHDK